MDNHNSMWPGWEAVRLIGHGSFGDVYEIERDMLGEREKAALKVISIPQSDSDLDELYGEGYDDESITNTFKEHLKSIVAEYSLMRKLNGSSNVVNCDDVRYVQHNDGFGWDIYIKMELLTPLTKALGKEISEEQVVRIGRDICRALVLCKKHNIIHRDIKPANIFVSENGDYKLGDFGIAKTVEKTSGGTKIGTYEYMAPEVYHDRPYGSTADIYSLGMVLYWLLNECRTPFLKLPPALPASSDKEQARKRRFSGEEIPAPAHGSEELKRIVLKACAYDPADRYQSAEDMLRDLLAVNNVTKEKPLDEKGALDTPKTVQSTFVSDNSNNEMTDTGACPEEETIGVRVENAFSDGDMTVSVLGRDKPAKKNAENAFTNRKPETGTISSGERRDREEPKKLRAEEEQQKKKNIVPIILGFVAVLAIALTAIIVLPRMGRLENNISDKKIELSGKESSSGTILDEAMALIEAGDCEAARALLKTTEKDDAVVSERYDRAASLIESGNYEAAYIFLDGLDFKDSAELQASIRINYEKALISRAQIGTYVTFGSYEQDCSTANGQEEIEWLVLDKDGERTLMISRYALDCQAFNVSYGSCLWEKCSLREWLNNSFLSAAFTDEEREMIPSTANTADKNPRYKVETGNNTADQVFLLSISEVERYFGSDEARRCSPTPYAISQGSWASEKVTVDGKGGCWWWLRSPGHRTDHAAGVYAGGAIEYGGNNVNDSDCSVRPALWVSTAP